MYSRNSLSGDGDGDGDGVPGSPRHAVWQGTTPGFPAPHVPVVGQRAHREPNLCEVEQVLERRRLLQQDAVVHALGGEERGREVVGVTRLARVRTERELREPARGAQPVQHREVRGDVVRPCGCQWARETGRRWDGRVPRAHQAGAARAHTRTHVVRRRGRVCPLRGRGQRAAVAVRLRQRLVVDRVEADDEREELVQRRVDGRVQRHVEERRKNAVQHVVKGTDGAARTVRLVQPRDLDHPTDLWACEAVVDDPPAQLCPLARRATVNL